MPRSQSALLPSSNLLTTNPSMRFSRTFLFLASLIACLLAVASPLLAQQAPALVTQPVDNSVRTILPGNVHPLARAEFDRGEAPPNLALHRMLLVLKRSDQQETALRRLIENQQYKKSSSYHQWLTPEEFGARFGPADSDIAAVTNWLQQSGFQIAQVSKGRTVIEFSGTAGQVKQAFGTAIHQFDVKGEQHWANVSDPSIPTALARVVVGLDSLHNFLKKAHNSYVGTYSEKTKQLTSPAPGFTTTTLCPPRESICYAVSPYDFATIYNLLPLWNATPTPINGTGETIAIVGRTDINPADATTFWSLFGLDGTHAPQPTLVITTNGPDPGFTGDESEADIDTQWSGAAAPGATINFVTSASTETTDGVDLSAIYVVDNNLAPVMSESYGQCEASLGSGGGGFFGLLWEQAAAQGISAMVSTGDNSAAGCDNPGSPAQFGLNVSGIASTPWNVAVGGTDFAQFTTPPSTYWNSTNAPITQESAKGPIPETTWNNSCANPLFQFLTGGSTNPETNCNNPNFSGFVDSIGGSGGASVIWSKPAWQTGTGVPNDSSRDLPDVSLFASNGFLGSFYVICQSDQVGGTCDLNNLLGFGGTSVSSPAFAGIMALVNQKWGLQGVPNFVLYKLAGMSAAKTFHDVPTGSTIQVPCVTGSTSDCITNTKTDAYGILSGYTTNTGYDLATGLGSVDANNLVTNWNKVTFTPSTTTLTLPSNLNVTHGSSVNVTVAVTPASPAATGDVSLLVSPKPGTPSIDWNTLGSNGSPSGTVTWTTNLLPGGTYPVIAHYAGDGTYGGSYSSPSANVTVNPESSSVVMPGVVTGTDSNGPVYSNSVVYGTGGFILFENNLPAYWLRADVLNSAAQFCTSEVLGEIACPTGKMAFTDNTSTLDASPYKLNSFGFTEDQTIQLTVGSHTLVATYSGDPSYKASSTSTTVTVTKATPAISNVKAPATAITNQQFTVTATVTTGSYALAPTGTVSFFYNTNQLLGTVQLTPTPGNVNSGIPASLAASLTTSIPTAGTYNITATYSGDGNYTAVTAGQSNSVPIVVSAPAPSFTLSANPTSLSVAQGANGTSTITVTPVNGFTGSVTLSASGLPAGVTAAFTTNPTIATSVLTLTASGSATVGGPTTVTITGTSGGSLMATTTIALTVTAGPSFTLSANPTSVTITAGGAGGTSTVTVTPTNGFTGTVSFAAAVPSGVTASFNPAGSTTSSTLTLTASSSATAGGPTTVFITGISGSLTTNTTLALTVSQGLSVPMTLTNPAAADPGQSASTTMALAPVGAGTFGSNVTYTCSSGLPTGATCSFNPTQINSGGSAQSVTVTVHTAGPFTGTAGSAQRGNNQPRLRSQNQRIWLPLSLPLAGMLLLGLAGRGLPLRYKIVGLCLALALTGFLVACGGGSNSPPPVTVAVSPSTVNTLYPNLSGAPPQTQKFTPTVTNSTNTAVTWEVNGVAGGNTTFGTIDASGNYTAPATVPSPATFNVTAVSQADTTKSGNASVTIQTPTPAGMSTVTVTVTEGSLVHTTTFGLTVN